MSYFDNTAADCLQELRTQALDELFADIESFRAATANACEDYTPAERRMNAVSVPNDAALVQSYSHGLRYRAYTDIAAHCLVTYQDPHASKREQRAGAKRIELEQATYAESLGDRRRVVAYRLRQLSCMYDGLIESLAAHQLSVQRALRIRKQYQVELAAKTRPSPKVAYQTFLAITEPLRLTNASHHDFAATAAADGVLLSLLARTTALSDLQAHKLPALNKEYWALHHEAEQIKQHR